MCSPHSVSICTFGFKNQAFVARYAGLEQRSVADVGSEPAFPRHARSQVAEGFIAMTHEEAEEKLRSVWFVEPPLLELIEGDYDSAQRKRYLRAAQKDRLHSPMQARSGTSCGV